MSDCQNKEYDCAKSPEIPSPQFMEISPLGIHANTYIGDGQGNKACRYDRTQ